MKPVTMILLLAALVSAPVVSCQTEWSEYKIKYNKNYNEEDEELRKSIFEKSKMQVEEHNKKFEEGLVSFTIGLNKFSDMTHEEYLQKHPAIDINHSWRSSLHRRFSEELLSVVDFPDRLDWRKEGAVTRVKDQLLKICSYSDWIFSVTGAVEGLHYIKTKKLTELSEQNILDCNGRFDDGCEDGMSEVAYSYIMKNNGIDTEASYPYEGKTGECRYKKENSGATITNFTYVKDENDLLRAVGIGPVAVYVDSTQEGFRQYKSGVYFNEDCSNQFLTLAALVVGYDTDPKGGDYWIVKNSWGKDWGNDGYIWMARNKNNSCGIASIASYPIL